MGSQVYSGTLTPGSSGYHFGGGGGTLKLVNPLTGSNNLVVNGAGGGTVVLASSANNYTGSTTISGGTLQIANGAAPGTGYGVFNNITEAQGYKLVYQLDIPQSSNYYTSSPTYAVDNSASIATGSFNRIGYYMELQTANSPLYYMYVSFNALPFATQANKLGVPTVASGEFYHYGQSGTGQVQQMDIVTNVPGISGLTYSAGIGSATNLGSGLAQFWPGNYDANNSYGVPNAVTGQWGIADGNGQTGQGYGSMKFGSDGVNGGPNTMLMSFDNWGGNGGNNCVGIGNGATVNNWFPGVATNGNSDYTFNENAASYTVEDLEVVVGNGIGSGVHGNLPATSAVSITSGSMLDLNGISQSLASLSGDATGVVALGGAMLIVGGNNASTTFAGTIADAGGASPSTGGRLVKIGSGTLVLSGTDSYSGGTDVVSGTLVAATADAIPDDTSLTIGAGGTFIFDPSQAAAPVVGSAIAAGSASAVPEPGTLVLLVVGALAAFIAWRRRRN